MNREHLRELQDVIEREMPLCVAMGLRVHPDSSDGLVVSAPLSKNKNHHQTGFAGSLSALCTVAGWGTVFLLTKQHGLEGSIVIRRGAIKYFRPVRAPQIVARCQPVGDSQRAYFVEMLEQKGQAKLDVTVEIFEGDELAVSFHGSYVIVHRPATSERA